MDLVVSLPSTSVPSILEPAITGASGVVLSFTIVTTSVSLSGVLSSLSVAVTVISPSLRPSNSAGL